MGGRLIEMTLQGGILVSGGFSWVETHQCARPFGEEEEYWRYRDVIVSLRTGTDFVGHLKREPHLERSNRVSGVVLVRCRLWTAELCEVLTRLSGSVSNWRLQRGVATCLQLSGDDSEIPHRQIG